MMRAAVLGSPIAHSLSPVIHQTAYRILEFEGEYTRFELSSDALPGFLNQKLAENWRGFSLTMPLKETVLPLLNSIDPKASVIASVNTVINRSGEWHGLSTDMVGFERVFANLDISRVALIGGGGTARAAVGALANRVPSIHTFLRTSSRRDALQRAAGETLIEAIEMSGEWTHQLNNYDLVISTVPSGVISTEACVELVPTGLLCEVLYHPWPTPLASAWQRSGLPIIDGIDLLVEQALEQIALFTERDFDRDDMRTRLLAVAREAQQARL